LAIKRQDLIFISLYIFITAVSLLGLLQSGGTVPSADWGIPLTESAAMSVFYSGFYIWNAGFPGGPGSGFTYFNMLYPLLAPLGFYGGGEVKALAFAFIFLSGLGMYMLMRRFGLKPLAAFLSGAVYMLSPIVFDHLVYGWIYYLISYTLLPYFLYLMKRQADGGGLHNGLLAGALEALALGMPSSIVIYFLLPLIYSLFDRKRILRGLAFTATSTVVALAGVAYYFFPQSFSSVLAGHASSASLEAVLEQYHQLSSLPVILRLGGSFVNQIYTSYFPGPVAMYLLLILIPVAVLLNWKRRDVYFFVIAYLFVLLTYYIYHNLAYIVHSVPYGVIFEGLSPLMFPAALGLGALAGYAAQGAMNLREKYIRYVSVAAVAFLVFFAGAPWFTGQLYAPQHGGPPSRLYLYPVPSSYLDWYRGLSPGTVVYYQGGPYALMSYRNATYPVNGAIFYLTSGMPAASPQVSSVLDYLILSGGNASKILGQIGAKYFVIYTNVFSVYNTSRMMEILDRTRGISLAYNGQYVKAYMVDNPRPIVNATIISSSPVSYTVIASGRSIVLLQAYSSGWAATMNGRKLDHEVFYADGFPVNMWLLNGSGVVKIYYEPQTEYMYYVAASIASFFGALALFCIIEFRSISAKHGVKGN